METTKKIAIYNENCTQAGQRAWRQEENDETDCPDVTWYDETDLSWALDIKKQTPRAANAHMRKVADEICREFDENYNVISDDEETEATLSSMIRAAELRGHTMTEYSTTPLGGGECVETCECYWCGAHVERVYSNGCNDDVAPDLEILGGYAHLEDCCPPDEDEQPETFLEREARRERENPSA